MDILVIVDMQNDFITGCLGTKEAQEILPKVKIYIIWDNDNLLDEKDSPTDKGIEVFKQLYKTKRIYKEVKKDE